MPGLFPPLTSPVAKLMFASGPLPAFVSAAHTPTKKEPWRSIRQIDFVHSTIVSLPEELFRLVWDSIDAALTRPCYAKVMMKLEDVLHGAFFTDHIKRGNILMLSEGEPGVDTCISLKDGMLRLEVPKEMYERIGIPGVPVRSGGRKHVKSRYLIEVNLRLPSMLHGKKRFERVVWAARNVLNQTLTWLFVDLMATSQTATSVQNAPLAAHHPVFQRISPSIEHLTNVSSPNLLTEPLSSALNRDVLQESLYDLFEYVDMLSLGSPRVSTDDKVDRFISRYQVPTASEDETTPPTKRNIAVLKWSGLMSVTWFLELLVTIIKKSRTTNLASLPIDARWLALTVVAHKTHAVGQVDGCSIVLQPRLGSTAEAEEPGLTQSSRTPRGGEPTTDEPDQVTTSPKDVDHDGSDIDGADHRVSTRFTDSRSQEAATGVSLPGFQHFLCAEYVDSLT